MSETRNLQDADWLLERLLDKWRGIEDEVSSGNLVTAGNYRQPSSIGWPAGKFEAMRDVVKDTRAYLSRPAAAATPRTMETCDHDPDLWYLICGGCGKTWRFDLARPAATPDAVSLLREFMARPAGSLPTLTWLAKVEQLLDGAA